jgi:hypothetical protein
MLPTSKNLKKTINPKNMSAKKKEQNRLEVAIANTTSTIEMLREEYAEKPVKPISDILTAQELSLMEMKKLYKETN